MVARATVGDAPVTRPDGIGKRECRDATTLAGVDAPERRRRRGLRRTVSPFFAAVVVIALASTPAQASAASFLVTTTADLAGIGGCASGGVCGLRQAITTANADAGPDTIRVPGGNYMLGSAGSLLVNNSMAIIGAGAATVIDASGDGGHRALTVVHGGPAPISVEISGIAIQGANTSETGAAIGVGNSNESDPVSSLALHGVLVAHNATTGSAGGGIIVQRSGSLTMDASRVTANGILVGTGYGGGLANFGTAIVMNSLFDANKGGYGGGIVNENTGSLTLTNTTITGNTAPSIAGLYTNGPATLSFDTIAGNTDTEGGYSAGYRSNRQGVHIGGTIIAGNTGPAEPECSFKELPGYAPISDGFNITDDGSCMLEGAGDRASLDPALGLLQDNGGPTLTRALTPGSLAIGSAVSGCPATDQRGAARPATHCDIGAYQANALADLALTGAASAPAAVVGQTATYTFNAVNNGPDAIPTTRITDQLPVGATLVSARPGCTGASTVVCPLGALAPGTAATQALTVRFTAPGASVDKATVGGAPTDPNPANDTVSLPIIVTALPIKDTITDFTIAPTTLIAASRGGPVAIARRRRAGAVVSYTNSQPATTTFTVQRPAAGRRRGRTCAKPNQRNRNAGHCTRYISLGGFNRTDPAGANRFRLTGRINGHELTPGAYRLQATPRNAAGAGISEYRNFRVAR